MKTPASIALRTLVFCARASFVYGTGVTYPDGSVSPFPPGFFGVGICGGNSTGSEVTSVAATAGTNITAVGVCTDANAGAVPVVFTPASAGFVPLSSSTFGSRTDTFASGISADGKIKIGALNGAATYWDASNQPHALPAPSPSTSQATCISRDGSTIGGSVAEPDPSRNDMIVGIGSLWATGGTGRTNVSPLDGYDASSITGLSQDGQLACGYVTRFVDASGNNGLISAVMQSAGGNLIQLPPVPGATDTRAYAIIATSLSSGFHAVGSSDSQAVVWFDTDVAIPLQSPVSGDHYQTVATGIAPIDSRAVAVGYYTDTNTFESTPLYWDVVSSSQPKTVPGLLTNTYKVSTGRWKLSFATCISGDGSTIGGTGVDPQGNKEGWIAVLPPILHPPILDPPGPHHANLGEVFSLQITLKNSDTISSRPGFSAKGLPQGFHIDKSTGIITGIWSKDQASAGIYTVTVTATNQDGSGSTSFTLNLPPGNVVDQLLQGHSYLPQNRSSDASSYYASIGNGISADGNTAVGTDGLGNDARAYQWTSTDGISGLPLLDGALRTFSRALASSADGKTIVGQAATPPDADGNDHAAATIWTTSTAAAAKAYHQATHYAEGPATASLTATNIGFFPQGSVSIANAVSADGSVVVGYGDETIDKVSYQVYQAFKWTQAGGMMGLGWLSGGRLFSQAYGISGDGSTIVGLSDSSAGIQAMRYTAAGGMAGLGLPPGASYGRAVAASNDGSVIAGFNTFSGNDHAFRWTAAEGMTDLGVLPGDAFSDATAVSADGSIVIGTSAPDFNQNRAFIWDKANGMRDLKSVLVAANPNLASWTLMTANSISTDGKTIVGAGKNPNGDVEGFSAVLQVQPARALNISTRMRVLSGDNSLIGGFIITGTEAKKVLIRGIGPSLSSFGVQGAMPNPTLELHQGSAVIARNDNWKDSQQSDIAATGIAPTSDLESAIVANLAPGAYTATLVDKNNQPGVGLVEVYDLGGNSTLANISTRGFIDTGDNVMIGGFIVGGGGVGGYDRVVVRALGPSLSKSGVAGALTDTTLGLHDNNGLAVATNDNWRDTQQADIQASGIAPTNDLESAIIETLAPGAYTAVVRGSNGATGVGLVEVYNLQ